MSYYFIYIARYNIFSFSIISNLLHVFFQYVNERSVIQTKTTVAIYDKITLVENIGVEPMTSCVQGRRSSQLS